MSLLGFKVNFDILENCYIVSWILLISSNYWQVVKPFFKNISSNYWQLADPYKRMHDPIIGTFIHNLDNTAPEIHVPISLCLIQILDVFFHSSQKSHYISSYFWMPGRIFTTVNVWIWTQTTDTQRGYSLHCTLGTLLLWGGIKV